MRMRAISPAIVVAMLIVIGIVLAVMIYFWGRGIIGGGSNPAHLTVTAAGQGSPDGTYAILTLDITNDGGSPAKIVGIAIYPAKGGVTSPSAKLLGASVSQITFGQSFVTLSFPTSISDVASATGVIVGKKDTVRLNVRLTAQDGLYPGLRLIVDIYYYDVNSRKLDTVSTQVQLA